MSSAFKGISSMMNRKAWPKALRGFRMVIVALMKDSDMTVENLEEKLAIA